MMDKEKNDFSAELIHQTIPDMVGTEARLIKRKCPMCRENCAHGWCGRCEKVLPAQEVK